MYNLWMFNSKVKLTNNAAVCNLAIIELKMNKQLKIVNKVLEVAFLSILDNAICHI